MKIPNIKKEDVSCWYELSWDDKGSIVLRVNKDFVKNAGNISKNAPIVMGLKEGFSAFEGGFEGKNFGFDKSFVNKGLNKDFFEMEAELPVLRKKSKEPCLFCKGTGKADFLDGICICCNGEGRSYLYEWGKAFAISASFTVFFLFSFNPEIQTSSNLKQLMAVQTITESNIHGGSIWGDFSSLLINWLKTIKETQNFLTLIRKASMGAYVKMDGRKLDIFHDYDFRVALKDGRLIMDCPGDACGINPNEEYWDGKGDGGYRFNCHNVDNPMQQLTLLAGLAALHDEARKAGV